MLVCWHDDFEMGHSVSDGEHRGVIDLLNELDVSLAVSAPTEVVDRALSHLYEAVASHFRHEEADWSGAYTAHRAEHDELLGRILQLQDDWRAGAQILDHRTLMTLARWWLSHICAHDANEGVLIH
ncbi:MAG: hemerythrin domain-containing protein [Magnetospirillum sp.]|nr:hemerythrin domain-containing protein [Magnetospirillum sp.]